MLKVQCNKLFTKVSMTQITGHSDPTIFLEILFAKSNESHKWKINITEYLEAILNKSLKEKKMPIHLALSFGHAETFTQHFCWNVCAVFRYTKLTFRKPPNCESWVHKDVIVNTFFCFLSFTFHLRIDCHWQMRPISPKIPKPLSGHLLSHHGFLF